jgi:hypothetical protein
VVDAAEAILLIPREEKGGAAMHAVIGDETHPPPGIAEGDQLLAEEHDADRRAIWLRQLAGEKGRCPVLAHEVAHPRARADATEQLVLLRG